MENVLKYVPGYLVDNASTSFWSSKWQWDNQDQTITSTSDYQNLWYHMISQGHSQLTSILTKFVS